MTMRIILALTAAGAVAACAQAGADACDRANRDINLGTLIANSATGAYDSCLADLEADLAALRLEGSALRVEAKRLEEIAATKAGEERRLTSRVAKLNAEQAALIAKLRDAETVSESEARDLLAEEKAVRAGLKEIEDPSSSDAAKVEALEERQRVLNRRVGRIFGGGATS